MKQIPITKPALPPINQYIKKIKKIWNTRLLSNFSEYALELEKIAAEYLQNNNVRVVSNGDIGLIIGLSVFNLERGSEVITPSFTFSSTANAILWNDLTPVFADIDENTFCLDPQDVEKKITDKTRVILGVNVFGNPSDIDRLTSLVKKYKFHLVFDSAHAYGSLYKGKKIGTLADIDVFSLSGTKLVTSGEGGIISVSNNHLARRVSYIRNYGFLEDYNSCYLGINGKISELNAALGCLTLPKIEDIIKKRELLVNEYTNLLEKVGDIRFQLVHKGNRSTYKDFCILTRDRNELYEYLSKLDIQTKKYFFPLHLTKFFSKYSCALPVTERVANEILCLPIYNDMTLNDTRSICSHIKKFYGK